MQAVIFIPGLGDVSKYIEVLTTHWPERFGLSPVIFRYGWDDDLKTYEEKYEQLRDLLKEVGPAPIVGISAGGSVAANILRRHQDLVTAAITICGPVRLREQDLTSKRLLEHPLLRQSIMEVENQGTIAKKVMTFRPLYDRIVSPSNVPIKGASNHRVATIGHVVGIPWILWRKARTISDFISRQAYNRS